MQVSGSARLVLVAALLFATLSVAGCAMGRGAVPEDMADGDAGTSPDAALSPDAEVPHDAPGCAIATGLTPVLDGTDDLAEYPAAQQLIPGAMIGSDAAAIAWNGTHLFVTVRSNAFTAPYEPLHVYLQTGSDLGTATAVSGKEYSSLVAAVPFAATHLIAVRRVSDAGSGAYNGVFVSGDGFTTRTLALDADTLVSSDQKTISVSVPWTALGAGGCPTAMRLALHVVHAQVANEWKDLIPSSHTPWQMPGGGYYEIDLTGSLAASAWTLR